MHDGCNGSHGDGRSVVDKLRMMGFHLQPMPAALDVTCRHCRHLFRMTHFEFACPECGMVHGVTPCHALDAAHVQAAGIGY